MKQNTITALLAVIAVLLGLNLIVRASPAAEGQVAAGLVEPAPVSLAVGQVIGSSGTSVWRVFRLWSDGAVDTTAVKFAGPGVSACDIDEACVRSVLPSLCTADITHNGEVDVNDFLEVIGQWGPCE